MDVPTIAVAAPANIGLSRDTPSNRFFAAANLVVAQRRGIYEFADSADEFPARRSRPLIQIAHRMPAADIAAILRRLALFVEDDLTELVVQLVGILPNPFNDRCRKEVLQLEV